MKNTMSSLSREREREALLDFKLTLTNQITIDSQVRFSQIGWQYIIYTIRAKRPPSLMQEDGISFAKRIQSCL